jgi:FKBP-type peptidyl-prolyl cis-trans isomerase
MRTLFALAAAVLTCSALAQPGTPPATKPAPATPTPAAPAAPTTSTTPTSQPLTQPGVIVPDMPIVKKTELEGGIICEDMKIGDGYEVKPGGAVVAMYHGWLKDGGKVFDSTYDPSFKHAEPMAFPLNGVIEGWKQGVPGMKIGGIRKLTIPSKLAYGSQGATTVPPNSDLVFVIELKDALQIEDIKVGDGEEVSSPFIAAIACTMTSDGKVVEKADSSKPLLLMSGEHQGLQIGMEGMKVGGKRRIIIPKAFNRFNQPLVPDMTQESPVTVELELLNARNMRPKTQVK